MRHDPVTGDSTIVLPEFLAKTKGSGIIAGWSPREKSLEPSIKRRVFNVAARVLRLCWPFFAEQQTNYWFACNEWGIGMDINNEAKREKIEDLVRKLMEEEEGKEMKKKAMESKEKHLN
uniref:Uncharacterized protein n=1 Tax=Manihot esculenta TaxID=3983 RepID=A0A2C9V1T1_MANES